MQIKPCSEPWYYLKLLKHILENKSTWFTFKIKSEITHICKIGKYFRYKNININSHNYVRNASFHFSTGLCGCSTRASLGENSKFIHFRVSNSHRCTSTQLVWFFMPDSLSDPTDHIPPGFPVHGILQARTLEWAARPSSRGSYPPRDEPTSPAWRMDSLPLSQQKSQNSYTNNFSLVLTIFFTI